MSGAPHSRRGRRLRAFVESLERRAARLRVRRRRRRRARDAVHRDCRRRVPDLLLLDVIMPGTDGVQLLQELKADTRWRDIPVLMVSSLSPDEMTEKTFGLGAADFIRKPFRPRELVARVHAQLRIAPRAGDRAARASLGRGWNSTRAREEAESSRKVVDILHEVTGDLSSDEIYHILARRVARALSLSRCSVILAKPGDTVGVVATAFDDPSLRNFEIELDRYPEIGRALETGQPGARRGRAERPALRGDPQGVGGEWHARPGAFGDRAPVHARADAGRRVLPAPHGERAAAHDGRRRVRRRGHQGGGRGDPPRAADRDDEGRQRAPRGAGPHGSAHAGAQPARAHRPADGRDGARQALRLGHHAAACSTSTTSRAINDTAGHLVGDDVLREVAALLQESIRSVDIVARYRRRGVRGRAAGDAPDAVR